MLRFAADFLTRELNAWLLARTGTSVGNALLTRIATDAGKWAILDDQVGVAPANVEEEHTLRLQLPLAVLVDARLVLLEPEMKLNSHFIFAVQFKNYDQGRPSVGRVDTNIRQIALSN